MLFQKIISQRKQRKITSSHSSECILHVKKMKIGLWTRQGLYGWYQPRQEWPSFTSLCLVTTMIRTQGQFYHSKNDSCIVPICKHQLMRLHSVPPRHIYTFLLRVHGKGGSCSVVFSHTAVSVCPAPHKDPIDYRAATLVCGAKGLGIQETLNWFNKNEYHTFWKLSSDHRTKIQSTMRIERN